MSVIQYWDAMYRDLTGPVAFSNGKASPEVMEAAGRLEAGARVIDIGCGDGRNALFLAAQGFRVTAIDISPQGIAKTRQFATERGLDIDASVQDIRRYALDGEYDLVISMGVLHLVVRDEWLPCLRRLQAHTRPGGYHAVGIMTNALPAPEDQKEHFIGLFDEGELFTYYAGWEILSQRSTQFHDEHPGGIRHHHAGETILARKPS